jgi:hypothetical protein
LIFCCNGFGFCDTAYFDSENVAESKNESQGRNKDKINFVLKVKRQNDRETKRQKDIKTERQKARKTERQRDRETE